MTASVIGPQALVVGTWSPLTEPLAPITGTMAPATGLPTAISLPLDRLPSYQRGEGKLLCVFVKKITKFL